jgi:hypothetical protein
MTASSNRPYVYFAGGSRGRDSEGTNFSAYVRSEVDSMDTKLMSKKQMLGP